jgi:hypothetical protein
MIMEASPTEEASRVNRSTGARMMLAVPAKIEVGGEQACMRHMKRDPASKLKLLSKAQRRDVRGVHENSELTGRTGGMPSL